jgi:hypothetical protein
LKRVTITSCSKTAVVVLGPRARLRAIDVTFTGNHGSKVLGSIIAAQDADVWLENVRIANNSASSS